ncbi:MAG: (d)CMP kinase [Thermodesulfobacteriota bacterium]|nr:(d)CMP kinase [Thermodesulfobacteriota bacterium]
MKPLLITIDGPAGAGKTTVSKALARRLGYRYVDTGALYRGVALAAKEQGVAPDDDAGLERLCRGLRLRFVVNEDGSRLFDGDRDISGLIRTSEISMLASAVSARPVVRKFLLDLQRRLGEEKNAVFEGRDMGTVVFPEAEVKFFLDASVEERARRRYDERSADETRTLEQITEEIRTRDHNDRTRCHAPLKPASDAILLDSTAISIDQVVQSMLSHIQQVDF